MKWFRFHADWIDNPKVRKLDATLQQRYILLLCMRCREEVPGISVADMAWHFRCNDAECEDTLKKLQDAGLWTGTDVANWDERQYVSDCSTDRSRKYRQATARQQDCNVAETLPKRRATAMQRPQTQTSDTDPDHKNSPTPRRRGAPVGAVEIVEHLNRITGKGYAKDRATKEIEGALSRGATVAECCEVLDYCWREWRDNPKMVGHVDKTTPFRKANFDRYLDAARAGRITTSTAPDNEPIPREVLANLEFELADGTDIEAWLAAQRPGWVPALRERASRMAGERR